MDGMLSTLLTGTLSSPQHVPVSQRFDLIVLVSHLKITFQVCPTVLCEICCNDKTRLSVEVLWIYFSLCGR
jgi:hypothetical protein